MASIALPLPSDGRSATDLHAELCRIAEICERAGSGDLEARVVGVPDHPELARLCLAINQMLDVADSFVREAAAAMQSCAKERYHRPILLRGLHGAYRSSAAVINQAGFKMKRSAEQISFAAQRAAENVTSVRTVDSACQELSATTAEISRQTTESAQLTERTVVASTEVGRAVHALDESVRKVSDIVGIIRKVAGQTNLLALNATIEAARAGELGRGFAVVAAEVKELSRSTATATEDIQRQVESMQKTAGDVSRGISSITSSIEQIDAGASRVARSVEEQQLATARIAGSISEVAENTRQVSQRLASGND